MNFTMSRCILCLIIFAVFVSGQTVEVKDRNGVPVVTVSAVQMFRYSDYFKEDIPDFHGTVKNISGEKLLRVSITGTVHKKDGSVVKFNLDSACGASVAPCDFQKDFVHEATYLFPQPWPFKPGDFDSIEFILEKAQRLNTKDGFHFSGFVAKDEGCFNDYLATTSLTGLALRKKLVELVEYGCGFIVEKSQAANILENTTKTFRVGTKKLSGVKIYLSDEGILLGLEPSPHFSDSGWVLLSALEPGPVLIAEEIGLKKEK